MNLNREEKKVVLAVFNDLLQKPYAELNTLIGSLTIAEMQKLYNKLQYEDYCDERNIAYEDMTEADFITAEEEKYSSYD